MDMTPTNFPTLGELVLKMRWTISVTSFGVEAGVQQNEATKADENCLEYFHADCKGPFEFEAEYMSGTCDTPAVTTIIEVTLSRVATPSTVTMQETGNSSTAIPPLRQRRPRSCECERNYSSH